VQAGLKRGVRVIPVLMADAKLPKAEYLPEPIRELMSREYRVVSDRNARRDVGLLADHLKKSIGSLVASTAAYLRALGRETEYIDIRGLQVSQQKAHRFRIDELYTPLTTVLAAEARGEPERQKPVPLQQALRAPHVVLVGDPGVGKSTFLRRIAFAACQALSGEGFVEQQSTEAPRVEPQQERTRRTKRQSGISLRPGGGAEMRIGLRVPGLRRPRRRERANLFFRIALPTRAELMLSVRVEHNRRPPARW
jgi:hypothetical protein